MCEKYARKSRLFLVASNSIIIEIITPNTPNTRKVVLVHRGGYAALWIWCCNQKNWQNYGANGHNIRSSDKQAYKHISVYSNQFELHRKQTNKNKQQQHNRIGSHIVWEQQSTKYIFFARTWYLDRRASTKLKLNIDYFAVFSFSFSLFSALSLYFYVCVVCGYFCFHSLTFTKTTA